MGANKARGEVLVEAPNGVKLLLRPTMDALERIESIVGVPYLSYVAELRDIRSARVGTVLDVTLALTVGSATREEVSEVIESVGLTDFLIDYYLEVLTRGAGWHEDDASDTVDESEGSSEGKD